MLFASDWIFQLSHKKSEKCLTDYSNIRISNEHSRCGGVDA